MFQKVLVTVLDRLESRPQSCLQFHLTLYCPDALLPVYWSTCPPIDWEAQEKWLYGQSLGGFAGEACRVLVNAGKLDVNVIEMERVERVRTAASTRQTLCNFG